MRIWIGKEREGNQHSGKLTMFVESKKINESVCTFIKNLLETKYNEQGDTYNSIIERVYLGAGKVDVTFIHPQSFEPFLQTCRNAGIYVALETATPNLWLHNANFTEVMARNALELIARLDLNVVDVLADEVLSNLTYKVDTGKTCIFTAFCLDADNSIEEVKDGMYECDQLIYCDYKGEKNDD